MGHEKIGDNEGVDIAPAILLPATSPLILIEKLEASLERTVRDRVARVQLFSCGDLRRPEK